jgi:hypothetical protein
MTAVFDEEVPLPVRGRDRCKSRNFRCRERRELIYHPEGPKPVALFEAKKGSSR